MPLTHRDTRAMNLGLQGGGAHGAFTWGVLDYLLEDGRVRLEGISGTSAGAMNAVVLAHGLVQDGRDGARNALRAFWNAVGDSMPFELATNGAVGQPMSLAPGLNALLQFTQYFSPEQLNPFDINPLRDILSRQVDFSGLRAHSPVKLFVAATNAKSGKLRIFRESELNADAVLASACLPTLHHTVEIDGEPYWDGAYAANPAVFPLFHECSAQDILLVLLTPREHKDIPRTTQEIRNRMHDLAFNATFLREMRTFATLQKEMEKNWLHCNRLERRLAHTRFHIIEPHDDMNRLQAETKLATGHRFLTMLHALGRDQAQSWMARHYAESGKRSTVDLAQLFY